MRDASDAYSDGLQTPSDGLFTLSPYTPVASEGAATSEDAAPRRWVAQAEGRQRSTVGGGGRGTDHTRGRLQGAKRPSTRQTLIPARHRDGDEKADRHRDSDKKAEADGRITQEFHGVPPNSTGVAYAPENEQTINRWLM
jgi:hypothetical protein